jgi:hypothetical protein
MAGIAAAAVGTACAAGLLRSEYERDQLSVEQVRLTSKKLKRAYTMVFLADLHDKEFGGNNERLLAAVRAACPDVILIGGDTMVVKPGKADLTVTEQLLKELVKIAPVYYGNGNHEQRMWRKREVYGDLYRDFRRILHRYGVVYLSDSSAKIGEDIRISGLNLEKKFYLDFKPAPMTEHYVKSHLGAADGKRFQILLAHSPLFFDTYAGWGADLTLAGHFHGGTIRLPYLGGVMTPQYQFFLPCCAGTFAKGDRRMIVSRGLGTHSINIRFGNKPQLVVLQLQPENRPESEQ